MCYLSHWISLSKWVWNYAIQNHLNLSQNNSIQNNPNYLGAFVCATIHVIPNLLYVIKCFLIDILWPCLELMIV